MHNLFGDTDAVHVRLGADGRYEVEHVVEGDDVTDVLRYVQYDKGSADREGAPHDRGWPCAAASISLEDSARLRRHYEQGLQEYTYLARDDWRPVG